MTSIPWILIALVALTIIIGAVFIILTSTKKVKKRQPDYYTWFMIGIIWIAIGIPLKNPALWIIGIVFTILGLTHRKDWNKNQTTWKDLSKEEKKLKLWILIILGIILIGGIAAYLVFR